MKFLGTGVWVEMGRLSKQPGKKLVAVPFYSSDSHVRCGRGDIVIVDATEETVSAGQTSAELLFRAHRRGARVFSHSKLHAKMLIAGDRAFVGSANLSLRSTSLREAGVVITSPAALADARSYFRVLLREAKELKAPALAKLMALPVRAMPRRGTKKPSLLEALTEDLPALADVAFVAFTFSGTQLSTREVKACALRRRLPLAPRGDWSWYEEAAKPGAIRTALRVLKGRPVLPLEVRRDASDRVVAFRARVALAEPVLAIFRLRGRVVTLVGGGGFRTPFDLRRDRALLAATLTAGIASAPPRLRAVLDSEAGVLRARDLQTLLRLGSGRTR